MKRNVLLTVMLAMLSGSSLMAATGSITVNSPAFPANAVAGEDFSANITYTADVSGTMNWGIFLTNANASDPDWGTWKTGGSFEITSGTDVTADYKFAIPGNFNSEDLEEGREYILALSLHDGSADFAWNNNGNILNITPSAVASNSIDYVTTPQTEVKQGDTVYVKIKYTVAKDDTLQVKVSITKYGAGYSWINGDLVAQYLGQRTETTTTPVEETIQLIVPEDAPLSSDLTNGEFYTFDIGIYTNSWGYITSKKSDVSLLQKSTGTPIKKITKSQLNAYPTPAHDVLNVNGLEKGELIQVFDLTGALVKSQTVTSTPAEISLDGLQNGVYILRTEDAYVKFIKD